MAWVKYREGNRLLQMTDGYVAPDATPGRKCDSASRSVEQRLADHLYSLGSRPRPAFTPAVPVESLAVWIVGAPGWLETTLPEPLRSIQEGETRDDYRIAIMAECLPMSASTYVNDWPDWVYYAGMKQQKRSKDKKRYRSAAETLLGVMDDHFDQTGRSDAPILSLLGVPIASSAVTPRGGTRCR